MKCLKCKSTNLKVIESGPHYKLVCADCLTFQKFISRSDKKVFDKLYGEKK